MAFVFTVLGFARSGISWLFRNPAILAGIGVLALVLLYLNAAGDARHWQKRYQGEVASRALDKRTYETAQRDAALLDAQAVERAKIKQEAQAKIAEMKYAKLQSDYRSSVANFVQRQTTRSAGRISSMPDTAAVPPGTVQTASEAVISNGYAVVPVSDLEKVADIVAQHDALQEWARSIGEVTP